MLASASVVLGLGLFVYACVKEHELEGNRIVYNTGPTPSQTGKVVAGITSDVKDVPSR